MCVKGTIRRILAVDRHAGIACAGLAPDGRQLVSRGRDEAAHYKSFYGDLIPGQVLADRMAAYMHMYTLYWSVRPYGATAVLGTFLAGEDPKLFVVEPTGVCHSYRADACGKGRQGVRTDLERLDFSSLSCEDAIGEIAKLMVKAKDESSRRETEVEMAMISESTGKQFQRVPDGIVKRAMEEAEAAIDADDMNDD